MDEIHQLVQSKIHSLNKTQQKIAVFLVENSGRIKELELNELAEATGTSRSSVLRFLKAIGFAGYREFKNSAGTTSENFSSDPVLDWLMKSTDLVVRQTFASLDHDSLIKAISRCAKAPRLFWYGVGESGLLAELANYRCWLMGIESNFCREMGHFTDFSHRIGSSEVLIVISRSGDGDYLYEPLKSIKNNKIFTIGITSNRLSWLAKNASVCLFPLSREARIETRYIPVRAACEFMFNALILGTAHKRGMPFQLGEDALCEGGEAQPLS